MECKVCYNWSWKELTYKHIWNLIIRHICYLEILIIMMQKVKQTTELPVNEMKILGQWNWTDSVPSSESRLTVKKGNKHHKSFKFSCV